MILDINGWLRGIGLEQYAQTFRDNEIDEAVLPNLTSEDLRELGVTIVGHRRKLLTAIGELSGSPTAPITIEELPAAAEPRCAGDAAERRQLTVMFVDLVGSTALSARLDPEDMREIVGAYHRSCAEQITKAGGFVAKYMGDGVLAYFGYPQAHEHDAERAVLAGLALAEAVPKISTMDGSPLQVRVGIATGLEIGGDDVAKLVAWRRGHRSRPSKGAPLISTFTVNDTTEQLKKLFGRAKALGIRFEHEPQWRKHWLAEPQERVRELVGDEAERLQAAMREDYGPFFAFVHASGLRQRECLLKWTEVDWGARQIRKPGKGGKLVTVPITSTIRAILWPLRGHHPDHVFTYQAQRTRDGRVQGERYPLTYSGVQIAWRRLRKRAGVVGFRFHDFRHDFGTKLLRETGNLKLVQRALNHSNIQSTMRYAHVQDAEVAAALERVQESLNRSPNLPKRANSKAGSA
ncbi:MAG TPA: tyrosine-type recombinase/integrase [Rhizomicrobium sp.]